MKCKALVKFFRVERESYGRAFEISMGCGRPSMDIVDSSSPFAGMARVFAIFANYILPVPDPRRSNAILDMVCFVALAATNAGVDELRFV